MNSHSRKRTLDSGSNDASNEPCRTIAKIDRTSPTSVSEALTDPLLLDPLVNGDVASIVFSFLDCRELLNMACTSKLLMERVTYEHVIRSSLMHGGHAKTSVERMVSLVKDRRIHVPSPMRLLRIANGRRCENCGSDKVNLVSADFGVFFGKKCCLDGRKWSCSVPSDSDWSTILSEPRMARSDSSTRTQVFARPYFNHGELHGPILTASTWTAHCRQDEGALVGLLNECDETESETRMEQIVSAYEGALAPAQQRKEQHDEEKRRKADTSWTKFEDQSKLMIERLNVALKSVPRRDILIEWSPPRRDPNVKRRIPGKFTSPLVNEWMSEYIIQPRRFQGPKVEDVAWNCRLLAKATATLLSFCYLSKNDPYESMLLSYCQKHGVTALTRKIVRKMDDAALNAIHRGDLVDALERLLPVRTIAIHSMAQALNTSIPSTLSSAMSKFLAELSWSAASRQKSLTPTTREQYSSSLSLFSKLNKAADDFMAAAETKSWLRSFPTRSRGVACLLKAWRACPVTVDLLLKRDTAGLIHLVRHGTPKGIEKAKDADLQAQLCSILREQNLLLMMGMGIVHHIPDAGSTKLTHELIDDLSLGHDSESGDDSVSLSSIASQKIHPILADPICLLPSPLLGFHSASPNMLDVECSSRAPSSCFVGQHIALQPVQVLAIPCVYIAK